MMGHRADTEQYKLFSTLGEMLNPNHSLYQLSQRVPWKEFEEAFAEYYSSVGRRAKPVRLMVSLLMLKQMFDLSDESVITQWVQNPYYQFFSGETTFQWLPPCDPTDLVHFRKRIKAEGAKKILDVSIRLHGKAAFESIVIADTTVQEKNITYPTDTKLYNKIIDKCLVISKKEGIVLRQTYTRILKSKRRDLRYTRSSKKSAVAKRAKKTIYNIAGRLCRELVRKLSPDRLAYYQREFDLYNRVLAQKKDDKNKIYSLHEPDVYCISKGKEHKKYEFGCKVSVLTTLRSNIIVGALSFDTNVYDGHTLAPALAQYKELTGRMPKEVVADRGYKGTKMIGKTIISIPSNGSKKMSANDKRRVRYKFKRRAAVEPIIGHMKSDTKLKKNFLKGLLGDKVNALLSAAGFNLRKWMRKFFALINLFQSRPWNHSWNLGMVTAG